MKSKGLQDLRAKATDWRTLMICGATLSVIISFSRYCNILHVGALQAYILFPLSFFILSQLIYQKQAWRNRDMWLAAVVFLWTVVSLLLNRDKIETPLLSGDYQHLCVSLFLCYPLAGVLEPAQRGKVFRLLAAINVIGVSLLCCFALYCVIFGIVPEVPFACESALQIDPNDGRLYLFTNANKAGCYCQAAALLCVYLMIPKQAAWKRILESAALVCIVCTLSLTDSRTAIFSFAAGIGMLSYLLIARASRRKGKRLAQVLLAAAGALISVVLCVVLVRAAKSGFGAVRTRVQAGNAAVATASESSVAEPSASSDAKPVGAVPTPATEAKPEMVQLTDRPLTYKIFTFTRRTTIWAAILKALPEKEGVLLHGTTTYADVETFEDDFPPEHAHGFHNSFLSLLICYGLPGLIVWLAFLAVVFVCGARVFFASSVAVDAQTAFLMSLLVAGFLVALTESLLFVDALPQASHTWLMLAGGLAVTTEREMRHIKKRQSLF